ncbi:hypothetical protein ASF92_02180 [Pedobacter sp. Leaf176]|nr:hypothetical protein ASF92_02180 [Pedobacter sp. Leaf176]
MMKVGINLFPLERDKWSGIEIYTYELIKFLNRVNLDLETYSLSKIPANPEIEKTNYKSLNKAEAGSLTKLFYNLYGITKQAVNPDVFHSTSFSLPYFLKAKKKVITIHDFAFYKHPELFDYKTKLYYKLILEHSIKAADRIICISKSCLADFEEYFPQPSLREKTRLVYNGFSNFSKTEVPLNSNPYQDYLFCVGASHSRKNLERTLKAYSILAQKYNQLKIVITGSIDPTLIIEFLNKNQTLENKVIHLNYVSQDDLINLYRHAKVLMFPSLYEGFGFPILEAMSCGVPVLTSYSSSCGEIAGYDSKFLVDPYNIEDIVAKTELILQSENYRMLVESGKQRVTHFSWEKMGSETLNVYRD